ncbi:TIGR01244 family sulfur transferase [uncultured Brevundimonas sp.]|uniref:TIGR01244 family sulfur transferase n=1 Tax=uncultured Brevundimonas sp. TaxID=213418 RepID=UPI0030ED53AE|tara:strand:+ start:9201 stop:9623 length:423 start_codon:yes stop_codon:yes gene_type:complete
MDIRKIDDRLDAAPQIALEDMKAIAGLGYRSVISNRPDGEEPGQPDAAQVKAAAEAEGLTFRHIPVTGASMGPEAVAAMRAALDELPGPVLGFCRSGTRTTCLWGLASAGTRPAQELIETARAAGYDLSPLKPRLENGPA